MSIMIFFSARWRQCRSYRIQSGLCEQDGLQRHQGSWCCLRKTAQRKATFLLEWPYHYLPKFEHILRFFLLCKYISKYRNLVSNFLPTLTRFLTKMHTYNIFQNKNSGNFEITPLVGNLYEIYIEFLTYT